MSTHRPSQPNGPYSKVAATSYAATGKGVDDPREIEAKALLKAARMLQELHDSWNDKDVVRLEKTITYNRQIWTIFYESALQDAQADIQKTDKPAKGKAATKAEPPNPKVKIRNNIVSLASFVFQRSLDIMAQPAREKLPVLITINREIAAGLMQKPEQF